MANLPVPIIMKHGEEYTWHIDRNVKLVPTQDETRWVCDCGATKNAPYCDGSHKALNDPFANPLKGMDAAS